MREQVKRTTWLAVLILGVFPLGAEDFLARGEKLLNENKPDQALVFLQAGLETGAADQKLYHYLALSYQSLGQNQAALDALEKGLALPGDLTYLLSYNQGNVLFQEGIFPRRKRLTAAVSAWRRILIPISSTGQTPGFSKPSTRRA
jgi:predicted Zn-dependent protease